MNRLLRRKGVCRARVCIVVRGSVDLERNELLESAYYRDLAKAPGRCAVQSR